MIVIMLGAPGSGKGTVGNLLSTVLHIPHISSGEIFRSYIKKHSNLAKEINACVQKGVLVPDDLTLEIIGKRLSEPDVKNGAILDGFPRTEKQAIELDKLFERLSTKVDIAVNLKVSDADIVKRIISRRTCPNPSCREIYNVEFKPPKILNICDKCGTTLIIREDDNEETVKQRLKTYHERSENLINFYKKKDILYTVKLNLHSGVTTTDIAEEIKEYLKK